jgi:hypothetical protein
MLNQHFVVDTLVDEQTLTANRYPVLAFLLLAIYWSVLCRWSGWAGARAPRPRDGDFCSMFFPSLACGFSTRLASCQPRVVFYWQL